MVDKMPLRWIEKAEARQVLTRALFERASDPSWCKAAQEAVAVWLPQIRSWLTPNPTAGWLQAQPALARRPIPQAVYRDDNAD